jgi:release factor glutamine methyltransferase
MSERDVTTPTNNQWSIIELMRWTTSYFKDHDIDSPRATAEILLAHALKLKRIDLYLNYDKPLLDDELQRFKALIKRRIKREPVAYIIGVKEFWSLDLKVNQNVLIPRSETECLVEKALDLLSQSPPTPARRILDLGTGSGAIVMALASQLPQHIYFASDRFRPAVEVARGNAGRFEHSQRIHFFVGDWFSALNESETCFDMIVSNPPYIPSEDIGGLQPEISRYEPLAALDGAKDGLACYRKIISVAHNYLATAGALVLEIGHDQRSDVRGIAAGVNRYAEFNCARDYSGYDRVVWMKKKG